MVSELPAVTGEKAWAKAGTVGKTAQPASSQSAVIGRWTKVLQVREEYGAMCRMPGKLFTIVAQS